MSSDSPLPALDKERAQKDRNNLARKERMKNDPEYAERDRARMQKSNLARKERRKNDPEYAERDRSRLRKNYLASKERRENDPEYAERYRAGYRKNYLVSKDRHVEEETFKCEPCDRSFVSNNSLRKHQYSKHPVNVSLMEQKDARFFNVVRLCRTDKLPRRDGQLERSHEELQIAQQLEMCIREFISTFDTDQILGLMQAEGDAAKPTLQLYVGNVAKNAPYCEGMYPSFYGPHGARIDPTDPNVSVLSVYRKKFTGPDRPSVKLLADTMKSAIQFILFIRSNHLEEPELLLEQFLNKNHSCRDLLNLDNLCPEQSHNPAHPHTKDRWLVLLVYLALRPKDYPIIDWMHHFVPDQWTCGQCVCAKGAGFCVVNLRIDPATIKLVKPFEDKRSRRTMTALWMYDQSDNEEDADTTDDDDA